eukprot:TRINITY_DN110680_c0_g1_i1.p1 TRINITY_DN110680_c0_g1~~TRINITY_DN110680_c0_g1_i1.p1  ORF type:complete len:399 (+),score=61.01 TRINITY_DN110680_c0_g1_i1:87-1283(+)
MKAAAGAEAVDSSAESTATTATDAATGAFTGVQEAGQVTLAAQQGRRRRPANGVEDGMKLFSFVEDLAEPIKQVLRTAYNSRGKLLRDVKCHIYVYASAITSMPGRAHRVVSNPKIHALIAEEEDPEALVAVVAGFGSALCLGSGGALAGAAAGVPVGTLIGVVPAIFTFGLSLPVGAIMGAGTGLCLGAAAGSAAGFTGGAVSGYCLALYRAELRRMYLRISTRLNNAHDILIVRPARKTRAVAHTIKVKASETTEMAVSGAKSVGRNARQVAVHRGTHCTAAGAAAGGAALGTAGAATGAVVGGSAGALIGLVPALFTFGLSIPIGAVIGGSAGLCAGAAAGGAAGVAGGGLAGYTGYRCRGVPGAVVDYARSTSTALADAARSAAWPGDASGGTD